MAPSTTITESYSSLEPQAQESVLHPTRTFYITPHGHFSSRIKVHDLTGKLSATYPTSAWADEAERIGDSLAEEDPAYTLMQPGLLGKIKVFAGDPDDYHHVSRSDTLAAWKPTARGHAPQVFDFPAGSPHASHSLTLAPADDGSYEFVMDSVEYIWRVEDKEKEKGARRMAMWKRIRMRETQVASFRSPQRFSKTGGTLVVDEREVDGLVVLLTCCAMLRKGRSM